MRALVCRVLRRGLLPQAVGLGLCHLAAIDERRHANIRHLLDGARHAGAKRLGHGDDYQYAHDSEEGIVAQDYLGVDRQYYRPVPRGFEKELAERLEKIRDKLREARRGKDRAEAE